MIRVQFFVKLLCLFGGLVMVEPLVLQGELGGTYPGGASNVLIPTVEQFAARLVVLVVL